MLFAAWQPLSYLSDLLFWVLHVGLLLFKIKEKLIEIRLMRTNFFLIFKACVVVVRPISPTELGGSVTVYCDLTNEPLSNLIWRRYNYNGSNILNLLPANVPARYTITSNQVNSSYVLSSIAISGVTGEDFATFECTSNGNDKQNLTQLSRPWTKKDNW